MTLKKKAILFSLAVITAAFLLWLGLDTRLIIHKSHQEIPANGVSAARILIRYKNPVKNWFLKGMAPEELHFISGEPLVTPLKTSEGFYLKARFTPGIAVYRVVARQQEFSGTLTLFAGHQDSDQDGIPDAAELVSESDRENFLKWFVWIAESQYYKISPQWQPLLRDCAGLIQFAFKEALKTHDSKWFASFPYLVGHFAPDIEKYRYPEVPLLKTRIFRINSRRFLPEKIEEDFALSATASVLMNHNMVWVGKKKSQAKRGDVLFFRRENHPESPYHSMIYAGESDYLIYHTGPQGKDPGWVRKVLWSELLKHPDKDWHPVPDNPAFTGIYRFKIVL